MEKPRIVFSVFRPTDQSKGTDIRIGLNDVHSFLVVANLTRPHLHQSSGHVLVHSVERIIKFFNFDDLLGT